MKVNAENLGYREVAMLADLMKSVSEIGLPFGEVAEKFFYDQLVDEAICVSYEGQAYHLSNGNLETCD